MSDAKIVCPECRTEIALTESLAGPLLERARREGEAATAAALVKQKAAIEAEAAAKAAQRQAAKLVEMEEAQAAREAEVARLREKDKAREAKLAAAQKAQAEALALQEALVEQQREMTLTIQKEVAAKTEAARAKLAEEAQMLAAERLRAAEEAAALKLSEKDRQMETMKRTIEELQRKAEQGSQQRQGEAAEILLEDRLTRAFPGDLVEPVPKGMRGADCLLRVVGAGTILWEVKRAANWSNDWLPKLRDDMRAVGADAAVLVSEVRPAEAETFALVDGVWVVGPAYAVPVAAMLRDGLVRVAEARGAREGQATKSELLYDYLTGPQFRARMEAVVEPFEAMQQALLRERKHMTAQWATREKQLEKAIASMMGMYGDVKGIAGTSVPQIEAFEPDLLEE